MERQRRSRFSAKESSGIVQLTELDVHGLYAPLARYAKLPTKHVTGFDPRYHSEDRLTKLYHDTEKWPLKKRPIIRLDTRHLGINSPAQYTLGLGARDPLKRLGYITEENEDWIDRCKIGAGEDSNHNLMLNVCVSEIELSCKKAGLRFIPHLEILKGASQACRESDRPLNIPISSIAWNMKHGRREVKDTFIAPDAMFAIEYPEGVRFFFVEYDTGTETVRPSDDLKKSSWLRKVLSYGAISKTVGAYLGFEKFYVLVLAPSPDRIKTITDDAVKIIHPAGSDRYCFQTFKTFGSFNSVAPPDDKLFTTDWQRVGHPPLNLARERRDN